MPNFTPNYNLEKPLVNESYSIGVFNANSDKLDTAIKGVSDLLDDSLVNYEYTRFFGDIKSVTVNCRLYCTGTAVNLPLNSSFYIDIYVNEESPLVYRKIRARRYSNNQTFETTMNNGVWTDWQIVSNGSASMNHYVTATGTNNLSVSYANVSLETGLELTIRNTTANTGNVTLNFNSGGAKPVLRNGGIQLTSGSLVAGGIYKLVYDGTNFILLDESGVRIKSVQRGTFNFNTSSTTQTINISSVDMSKSIVKIQVSSNATTAQTALVAAQLTSATVVTLYKGTSNTSTCQVFWEVVEYEGNVSVQRGRSEITAGNQELVVNISAVNMSRTINITTNTVSGGSTVVPAQKVSGRVVTSSTITLYRIADDGSTPTYWQVLEFK